MKKILLLGLVIVSFLSSCKDEEAKKTTNKNELQETKTTNQSGSISPENNNSESEYCNIELANNKGKAHKYSMTSSDGVKKGFVFTSFDVALNNEMSQKKDLEISFIFNRKGSSPKLNAGTYKIKSIGTNGDDSIAYFNFVGALGMKTYEEAVKYNRLEDIDESFIVVPNEGNKITFKSIKDLDSDNSSKVYETGKQLIEGNLIINLLQVKPKENFTLKIDFKIINEWTITQ